MKNALLSFLLLTGLGAYAQNDVLEGRQRLNFAQTYMEAGGNTFPGFSQNPPVFQPNLTIGGIHFWGYADFYVTFPLTNMVLNSHQQRDFQLSESAVTGARFMPLAYKKGRFTPYLGAAWSVFNFKQGLSASLESPQLSKNTLRFDVGFIIGTSSLALRAGVNYLPFNDLNYPISKTQFSKISLPAFYPSIGVAYIWETTRSKSMEDINKRLNKYPSWSSPKLQTRIIEGIFVGAGVSSSFRLSNSLYNQQKHPYLNNKPIAILPDFALGYHWGKQGFYTALSFRRMNFNLKGFQTHQQTQKQSLAFEIVVYISDYNGFTPYIGANLGLDKLIFDEKTANETIFITDKKLEPGLTFGWDILPGKTRQQWVLRTNMRWYPFQSLTVNGIKHNLSQLEYNFIQLVWYPTRSNNIQ